MRKRHDRETGVLQSRELLRLYDATRQSGGPECEDIAARS